MEPKEMNESIFPAEVATDVDSRLQLPAAPRKPVEHRIHGDVRVDEYSWLREKDNPEVIQHLEAENAYTKAVLQPTEAFQEQLYQEMLSRIQQTDLSVPYQLRGYLYFTKTEEGKQYPLHFRQGKEQNNAEELLLDLNVLAEGYSFLGLGVFEVSDDNRLLAYSTDTTGFRQYTLQIKDLQSEDTLDFRAERVTSAVWASDSRTLFYTVEDELTKRSHRLYRHTLGETAADLLLFEETDERFRIEIERTRSGAYLVLLAASHTTSEVRFLPAGNPAGEFRLIAPREDSHEYYVEHHPRFYAAEAGSPASNVFLIRTNSGGRTFRLVRAPVDDPQRSKWKELVPNRPNVMLSAVEPFHAQLVLFEREGGLPFLRVIPLPARSEELLAASYRI